jgi:hypothetical protein
MTSDVAHSKPKTSMNILKLKQLVSDIPKS